MKKSALLGIVLLSTAFAQRHNYGRHWRVEDDETIRRTFTIGAGSSPRKLLVDNISGSIHVTGYSGHDVQITAQKHIGADSAEAVQEAKRDVKLDISLQGNFVRVYVDGPFRNQNGTNYRGDDYYGYRVNFDYEIQVPFATELVLKTVNNGDIVVKKTTADFEINGVNGGIEMDEVAGSGKVATVNGAVKVAFTKNPSKDSEFRTLNGTMDVYFQPSLNADLNFHTLNGGIYTDFEVTTRPSREASGSSVNGKFVYHASRRSLEGRAGKGGPQFSFNTLNGDLRLHSKAL